MSVSHSLFWMDLHRNDGTTGNPDVEAGSTPTYQFTMHPRLAVTRRLSLDATWYHVDDLPAQQVAAYDRLDVRFDWTPTSGLELSAGVQNLLHDGDLEFSGISGTNAPTTIHHSVYGKVKWKL